MIGQVLAAWPLLAYSEIDDSQGGLLAELAARPRDLIWLADLTPLDPSDGSGVVLRVSDTGYWSGPTDSISSGLWRRALRAPYAFRVSVTRSGRLLGAAIPSPGAMVLLNDGSLDSWPSYSWAGAAVTVKVGPGPWWEEVPLELFSPIFRGKVSTLTAPSPSAMQLNLRSAELSLSKPWLSDLYLGKGGAVRIAAGEKVDFGSACLGFTGSFSIGCFCRLRALVGTEQVIASKRSGHLGAGGSGWEIYTTATGGLRCEIDDGTNSDLLSGGSLSDAKWHFVEVVRNSSDATFAMYLDGVEVDSMSLTATGVIESSSAALVGDVAAQTHALVGEVGELLALVTAHGAEEALDASSRLWVGNESNVTFYCGFQERVLSSAENTSPLCSNHLVFNGTSARMNVPASLHSTSGYSIELMIKDGAVATFNYLYSEGLSTDATNNFLGMHTSAAGSETTLRFRIRDSSSFFADVSFANVFDGAGPKHILLTDLAGTVRLYVNGVEHASSPLTYTPATVSLDQSAVGCLRRGASSYSGFWPGNVYYGRGWSRIISPEEAPGLVANEAPEDVTGLVWYAKMDEGTGTPIDYGPSILTLVTANTTWADSDGTLSAGAIWSSTMEGEPELNGVEKPRCVGGPCEQMEPVLVDAKLEIWQIENGPIDGVVSIEDQGVPWTNMGNTIDLIQVNPGTGQYWTDVSRGLFRAGQVPNGALAVTARGSAPAEGYSDQRFELIKRIALDQGIDASEIDLASFQSAAAADVAGSCGIYVTSDVSAIEVMAALAQPDAVVSFDRLGRLRATVWPDPATAEIVDVLDDSDIVEDGASELAVTTPAWRVRIGHRRFYLTQSLSDLAGSAAELSTKQQLAQEYRFAKREQRSTLTPYPEATDEVYFTQICTASGAEAMAERIMALYGVRRRERKLALVRATWEYSPGDVIDDISTALPAAGPAVISEVDEDSDTRLEIKIWF